MNASLPAVLDRAAALEYLYAMVRIRRFEDRWRELYQAGKIRGFLHLCNGEEAVAVGVMRTLGAADAVVSTCREHGHALARGVAMNALMAELYGKVTGTCRGRGGSMHIFDVAQRFYGGNAIVGGGLPLAVGLGLAEKLRGTDALAACLFGEGAMAEGEFHESLNLAALWQLPVLFLCENNLYAMGTALARSESQTDLTAKAAVYNVSAVAVDGMDVLAVEAAARDAVARIRDHGGPSFIEFRTYRFRAHSMFDAQLYREQSEVEDWRQRGPIVTFMSRCSAAGLLDESDRREADRRADAEVDAAVAAAEAADLEPAADLARFVYAETAA